MPGVVKEQTKSPSKSRGFVLSYRWLRGCWGWSTAAIAWKMMKNGYAVEFISRHRQRRPPLPPCRSISCTEEEKNVHEKEINRVFCHFRWENAQYKCRDSCCHRPDWMNRGWCSTKRIYIDSALEQSKHYWSLYCVLSFSECEFIEFEFWIFFLHCSSWSSWSSIFFKFCSDFGKLKSLDCHRLLSHTERRT